MPAVYRLTRPAYSPGSGAVPGLGAAIFGGRWNQKGTRAVYTSGSIALAVLEVLVHGSGDLPDGYELWTANLPSLTFPELDPLPDGWQEWPYRSEVQQMGNALLASSFAIRVPSAVVPLEHNYI